MSIEAYIKDVSHHSYQICGKLFSGDFTQIVKQNYDGTDLSLQHGFYSIDDEGLVKQLGGLSFSENAGGSVSLNLNVTDPSTGEMTPVLALSPDGVSVTGGIDVMGGSTNFESSSISVADYDLTLGSGATTISDLVGGGIVLGTPESGTKTIRYSELMDSWTSNVGFNVETGHRFTVNTDSVVLDEAGLTISDIILSQNGLKIGNDVELNSESLTIGETNPVVLNASGLTVGDSLSLSTSAGLQAGDISLDSDNGLVIGTGQNALVLDSSGLFVGESIELSVNTGLTLGTDVQLSNEGLRFSNADAAIYMGPTNQWKISFDSVTQNIKFEFFNDSTNAYVSKMELKSTN